MVCKFEEEKTKYVSFVNNLGKAFVFGTQYGEVTLSVKVAQTLGSD